jgi:hypothetical protein
VSTPSPVTALIGRIGVVFFRPLRIRKIRKISSEAAMIVRVMIPAEAMANVAKGCTVRVGDLSRALNRYDWRCGSELEA